MKGLNYYKIHKYIVTAVCDGPLHMGSSMGGPEEVLIHPVNGFPFIQASSIAGVFRGGCNDINPQLTEKLFGSAIMDTTESQSRVRFTDGTFTSQVVMELRPQVRIDRKTGSAASINGSGQKFNTEYIGAGAVFTFTVYLYSEKNRSNLQTAMDEILALLKNGGLQFGAKKSSGAGCVHLTGLLYKEFDLTTLRGRNDWMAEEDLPDNAYDTAYMDRLPAVADKRRAYTVRVKGTTEGNILVKGIAVNEFGKDAPDYVNIQNANKDYIIPGTSLRGSFYSQMEKIAAYLGKDALIPLAFGTQHNGDAIGNTGNLVFSDTVVGDRETNDNMPFSHRIHIDKFTGGVFQKGLFSEKNVAGDMILKIDVQNRNRPDETLALLVLALRDLAIHTMSLGSGYSIGKGMITVEKIEIFRIADEKKAVIVFGETLETKDPEEILTSAFNALKEYGGIAQ